MNSNRLYTKRTLSETVNMVFDFVGEHWRLCLRLMVYFLLPFSVLLGATIATFYNEADESMSAYVISAILFIAGCTVVTTLGILLVKWHEDHNGSLDGLDASTMLRLMPGPSLRCLGIIVLGNVFLALAFVTMIIPIIGFVAVFAALPVFLVCPIMLLESRNLPSGLVGRAFSLGYKKWGTLILLTLIMGVVAALINNAATFPLGIITIVESLLEQPTADSVLWTFILDLVRYVLCVAECFIIFVGIGLFVLAMTYHYGSVATEVDDIGLENDINNFADLK